MRRFAVPRETNMRRCWRLAYIGNQQRRHRLGHGRRARFPAAGRRRAGARAQTQSVDELSTRRASPDRHCHRASSVGAYASVPRWHRPHVAAAVDAVPLQGQLRLFAARYDQWGDNRNGPPVLPRRPARVADADGNLPVDGARRTRVVNATRRGETAWRERHAIGCVRAARCNRFSGCSSRTARGVTNRANCGLARGAA